MTLRDDLERAIADALHDAQIRRYGDLRAVAAMWDEHVPWCFVCQAKADDPTATILSACRIDQIEQQARELL